MTFSCAMDHRRVIWFEGDECPVCDAKKNLRDHFAGKAMAIIVSHYYRGNKTTSLSRESYVLADDMLKAREEPTDTPKGD